MEAIDEDGNAVSIESTLGDDPLDQPDEELASASFVARQRSHISNALELD